MAIILKDQTPSGVPTPDSGKTAIITDAGGLYIKDDTGAVTHITSGGTVTSVSVAAGSSKLSSSGSPITSSGTITLDVDEANLTLSNLGGTLSIAKGGTGQTTANAAFNALAPSQATNSGKFLTTNGTDTSWASINTGTVTSVDVTGSNGIGVSGSPITSSGTISLSLGDITPTSVAASGTVTGSNLSGTNTGDQTITLTGDVTGSGTGSFATTIAAEAVSLSKMANLAANSIIGNNTGSAATPIALTQAQFTAMVNTFSSSLSGAVPASGGGTTNFLRADGTWAAPAGGSGTVTSIDASGGSTGLSFSGGPITTSGTLTLGGTLAIANGGTGQTSKTNAFDALAPTTTTGDLIYHNGTDNVRLGIGSAGQVLTVASGSPTWAAASGGGGSVYYKDPVRVATTAAGTLSTSFANGQSVDGVTLATGDRILIKNQTAGSENGIYVVNASGAPTRATDFDTTGTEVSNGCVIPVALGTVNGGSLWQLVQNGGSIGNSFRFAPVNNVFQAGVAGLTTMDITGTNAIGIGAGAASTGTRAIAIGGNASWPTTVNGTDSIGIGRGVTANGNASVVIGATSDCGSAASAIIISSGGGGSINRGAESVLISAGTSAFSSTGTQNIGIGRGVYTTSPSSNLTLIGAFLNGNSGTVSGSVVIGYRDSPEFTGQFIHAVGGNFAAGFGGDAVSAVVKAFQTTTNATATELGIAGNNVTTNPTGRIVLTNDSSYIFDCDIIARNTTTDTETAAFNLKFCIRRGTNAASTTIVGTPVKTILAQDTGTTSWDVSVTADTTNGRPNISVTGEASKTIRWVANIRMTKVSG